MVVAACSEETHVLESLSFLLSHPAASVLLVCQSVCAGIAIAELVASGHLFGFSPAMQAGALRRFRAAGLPAALTAAQRRFVGCRLPSASAGSEEETLLMSLQGFSEMLDLMGVTQADRSPAAAVRIVPPPPAPAAASACVLRGEGGALSSAAAPPVPQVCRHCCREPAPGQPTFKLCGGCRAVRFCGDECRRAGWKAGHKAECRAAQAAAAAAGGAAAAAASAAGGA